MSGPELVAAQGSQAQGQVVDARQPRTIAGQSVSELKITGLMVGSQIRPIESSSVKVGFATGAMIEAAGIAKRKKGNDMKQTMILLLMVAWTNGATAQLLGEKKTADEQRTEITTERTEILKKIFEDKPELEKKMRQAPGYATFSSVNVNLLVLATARGTGVVTDNKTGEELFMKVTSIGGGLGAGIKDLRALMIFNEKDALTQFIDSGWQFDAQADASLKSGDKGAAVGESASAAVDTEEGRLDAGLSSGAGEVTQLVTPIEIYSITEAGISLQATIAGTKFSQMDELNGKADEPKKGFLDRFKKDEE